MPLAVGFAVGYVVARKGGVMGTVASAKNTVKRV